MSPTPEDLRGEFHSFASVEISIKDALRREFVLKSSHMDEPPNNNLLNNS